MEDKVQQQHDPNSPKHSTEKSDQPVRSRWTPKPEQILILESIFNSGMVNPPKDETIRIRKLLEKFGAVGDANVFYWFQNRRSRSRRRQRQLQQASLEQRNQMMVQVQQQQQPQQQVNNVVGGAIPFDHHHQHLQINPTMGFVGSSSSSPSFTDSSGSSSSSCGGGGGGGVLGCQQSMDGFFSVSSQMGFPGIDQTFAASSLFCPPNLNYQSGGYGSASVAGFITVFINGIATEVQAGPIDMKTVFGDDVMLVHSSGVPVPTNEYGFLMQSLEHGESYFLVGIKVNTSVNGSACAALEAFP